MRSDPHSLLSLRLYRILLFAGGVALVGFGALYRLGEPDVIDPTAGRMALALAAVAIVALTFLNEWVYRHALGAVYLFFAAVSGWQIWLAHVNDLSPTSVLGLVLVFFGCSAGLQTTRALALYSAAFLAGTAAVAFSAPSPSVSPGAFVATLSALALLGTAVRRSQMRTLERLRDANEKALAAVRAKSAFLATMSHEIRTPMNGVIGMTDLLATTPLSEDQRETLDTIRSSGLALLSIINDILDVSKMEAGRLELESRPLSLADLLEEAVEMVMPEAAKKPIEVVVHVRPEVPAAVLGDATRIRQIALNLLSNAVKFTERGSVVVEVALRGRRQGAAELLLSVSDTGIGIPADALERIFEPFSQVDASTTRRYGGTGLGLVISRTLAEQMGGRLWAERRPQGGSAFHALLALPEADAPPRAPETDAVVLIVDDHPETGDALADLVRTLGFRPHVCTFAEEALAWLDGGATYALALIDLDLAGDSGADLGRRLRAMPGGASRPLFLLTPPGARPAHAGAFDAVLSKPVRSARLRALIGQLTDAPAAPAQAPPEPALAPSPSLRVLLAEDHEVNRRVALGLLRHLGIHADTVGTGREAIEAVRAHAYDLVLMDVQMPDIDGLDATRAIRAEIRAERQPRIVALTANALAGDAEACFAAGMDAFLAKPVRLDALRAALVDTTTHRAVGLAASSPTATEAQDASLPDAAHVLRSLRALSDNDDALCAEILDAYLRSDETLIAELRSGTEQAAGAAHKIKASSGTLGADALARRAALVEQQTRAGEAGATAAARTLADELDAFRETVREVRAQLPEAPAALTDAPQADARRAS